LVIVRRLIQKTESRTKSQEPIPVGVKDIWILKSSNPNVEKP
jgi:hypothetical protein